MIIKSSARGGATNLAIHLTRQDENEEVLFSDSRYLTVWQNEDGDHKAVHNSLQVIDALSAGRGKKKNLFHVSINPDQNLTDEQWHKAWSEFEDEFDLKDRQYIEVTHVKNDRLHKHRVYNRIKDNGAEVSIWYNYQRTEKVSRKLEYQFGHELTLGKHNQAVIKQLQKEGHEQIASWLEEQAAHQKTRPVADKTHRDYQQEKRTKIAIEQVKAELTEAYQNADTGRAFEAAIAEKGYLLAQGDRRDFVILDSTGAVHSPRRRIGVKAKELRTRWADLDPDHMPTVEEAKQILVPDRPIQFEQKDKTREELKGEIEQIKQQAEAELLELNQPAEESKAVSTATTQSNGSTQQRNRPQKSKKNLKQRLFTNHRRNRLAKPVKKRRRASRASTPRTAYQYRKRVWLEPPAQELAQPQLDEPIEPTVTPSQPHKEQRISSEVHQRTAETLLPHVLQGADGSQDDEPTITKPQKGQGDKTPTDPAKHKDQRKDIETWTKLRGEGRDSIKPLNREAQPTIRDRYRTTSETVIPTHKTALTEAGFFPTESEPEPPQNRNFARMWEDTFSTISMSRKKLLESIISAYQDTKKFNQAQKAKRDLAKQQRDAAKEKKLQNKLTQIERKPLWAKTDKDYKFERKMQERAMKGDGKKTGLERSIQQPDKNADALVSRQKTEEAMTKTAEQFSNREQDLIRQSLLHKQIEQQQQEHFRVLDSLSARIKSQAPPEKQADIDTYFNARKELINNPNWSAYMKIREEGETPAWRQSIKDSADALEKAENNPTQQLTATEEYQAEFARTANYYNLSNISRSQNPTNAIENDKLIAQKMYGSGRSKTEIYHAVREASPNVADLSEQESHMYVQQQIDPVFESQITKDLRHRAEQFRERENISTQERRLDQLNLHENRDPQSRGMSTHIAANSLESELESDSGIGY